jgi:dolichol-phosphate mannosyltransferase
MISIVSPVYNGENTIEELVHEIEQVMYRLNINYEIILVDDRSPDNSWEVMTRIAGQKPSIKIYRLSRNFGQHATIIAGLSKATGDWVIVMDCDLQDQPKEIEKLYNKASEGFDIVMAKRNNRKDSFFKKSTSKLFAQIFNFLSDTKINHEVANFGIYKRKVILEVLKIGDFVKSFPLFIYYLGYRSISIPVEHSKRTVGKSNYSISKLISLAFNAIISYSNKPLKLIVKIGLIISFSSFSIGIYYMNQYFNGDVQVPGYSSLIISIFFLSGIIISVIGILGIYLGKVFEQTKNRPSFVFDEEI